MENAATNSFTLLFDGKGFQRPSLTDRSSLSTSKLIPLLWYMGGGRVMDLLGFLLCYDRKIEKIVPLLVTL